MINFVRNYPIIEAVIVIVASILYGRAWRGVVSTEESISERSLGATVVIGQLNGIITAGSLTLALIGATSAALLGSASLPVKTHAFWAMIFILLSIISALLAYGVITTYLRSDNVARHRQVVILAAISLLLFGLGLLRLIFGIWWYVWP